MADTGIGRLGGPRHSCGGCCTKLVGLSVSLGNAYVLHDVNLHVHCGELTVVIGPNGAGKTTLFRALLREVPYRGSISFYRPDTNQEQVPRIGYVPQRLDFDASSPNTVLDLFAAAVGRRPAWLGVGASVRAQARQALEAVQAQGLLSAKLGQLSGGELQRVLLGLALTPVPDILLLDEPVSGVDPNGVDLFYRMVSELRKSFHMSIIMVSHDFSAAAHFADRIVFLNRTVLCDGDPATVLASGPVTQTFGFHAAIPIPGHARRANDACPADSVTEVA